MSEKHCACHHSKGGTPYVQSISEIEFGRGIWQAAIDNDMNKIKQLLTKGHNINAVDVSGYTALHYAARNEHFDLVNFLLEHKASVNCITKAGQDTPLHRAAFVGHLGIIKSLVTHGGRTEIRNVDGQTCLHKAVQRGHLDVVRFLVSQNPNLTKIEDNKLKTPLVYGGNDDMKDILDIS